MWLGLRIVKTEKEKKKVQFDILKSDLIGGVLKALYTLDILAHNIAIKR